MRVAIPSINTIGGFPTMLIAIDKRRRIPPESSDALVKNPSPSNPTATAAC